MRFGRPKAAPQFSATFNWLRRPYGLLNGPPWLLLPLLSVIQDCT
jgi:hypothetical protein